LCEVDGKKLLVVGGNGGRQQRNEFAVMFGGPVRERAIRIRGRNRGPRNVKIGGASRQKYHQKRTQIIATEKKIAQKRRSTKKKKEGTIVKE